MPDSTNDDQLLSHCHKAPIVTISADEGTAFWQCSECKRPCNIAADEDSKVHDFVGFGDDELREQDLFRESFYNWLEENGVEILPIEPGNFCSVGKQSIRCNIDMSKLKMAILQRDEQVAREARIDVLKTVNTIRRGEQATNDTIASHVLKELKQLTTNHKGETR